MALKNLMVRVGADVSNMQKGMKQAQSSLEGFSRNMSKTTKAIGATLATIGAGVGFKAVVGDAMAMEASLEQVNRMMGKSAQEFVNWAESSAGAFNFSKKQAIEYGGVFSNLISTFAKDTQQIQGYTQSLLEANAVVASKTGRTIDDVNERIRSGMLGNTEAIEDLGIFVGISMIESTDAFRRFAGDSSWQKLDFQTQQTIRYFAILEQAATKYGATVSGSTSSQTAQLVAQLNNLKLTIGQAFLPIWQTVLPALSAMVGWLVKAANTVAQFMQVLFGKTPQKEASNIAKGASSVASAVGGVGDAYKGAGSAAKKAAKDQKGFLAGFDEINSVPEEAADDAAAGDSGGGAGGGTGAGGVDASAIPVFGEIGDATFEMSEKIKEMAEKVKGAFSDMKNFIVEHKDIIVAALGGIAAGIATFILITRGAAIVATIFSGISKVMSGIGTALAFLLSPIGLIVLAVAGLVAGFIYFYKTNDQFKGFVDGIFDKIKDAAVWLWEKVLVPLGDYLAKGFVIAWEAVKKAAEWTWKNVMIPLGEFFVWLWETVLVPFGKFLAQVFVKAWDALKDSAEWLWKNVLVPFGNFLKTFYETILTPLGKVLSDVLVTAFKFVMDIAKMLWNDVLVPLGKFLKEAFSPTVDAVSAVFTFLWNSVLVPLAKFLGAVFMGAFKALTTVIEFLWYNVLKPLVPFITGILTNAFKGVGDVIDGLKNIFIGLMNFITGVFTGDWKKAWEGVKQIFKGIFDSLWGIVKVPLNNIIDGINGVISGLNKIKFDMPDWMGGKSFGVSIPKIPKLAKGGITNGPMLAMVGDNVGGQEVVSPLDDLKGMIAEVVSVAMGQGNNQQIGDIVIQLNEVELGRASAKGINKAQRISGRLLLDI